MIMLLRIEKNFQKKSGGIIVIFKEELRKFLRFIKTESEFVQWVDISKNLISIENNILLGCTYIPPEYSKYSSPDSYIEVEEELLGFSQNTQNIVILGDFNARTSTVNDYIIADEFLHEISNIE